MYLKENIFVKYSPINSKGMVYMLKRNSAHTHTKKKIFNSLSFITILPSAILILLAVLFLASSFSLEKYFKSEMQKMMNENLNFMSQNLDFLFDDVMTTVSSYSTNSDVKNLSYNENYGASEVTSAGNLQKTLSAWVSSKNIVYTAQLYFSESNLLISNNAIYYNDTNNDKAYLNEDMKVTKVLQEETIVNEKNGDAIEVIPVIYPVSADCRAIVLLNSEYLDDLIFSEKYELVEFSLISQDGTVIKSNGMSENSGGEDDFIYITENAKSLPLTYTLQVPQSIFGNKIKGIIGMTGVLTVLFLLGSVVTFIVLRMKVYRPITNMVSNIEMMVPSKNETSRECAEIRMLRNNMDKIFSENYEFKLKESEANNMQNELIVQRVLFGVASDDEIERLNESDAMFSSYVVLSIFFGCSADDDIKTLRNRLFDGINQAVEAKHLYIDDEKAVRYIVQIRDESELDALRELLNKLSESVCESDMFVLFCVSDMQNSVRNLHSALMQSESIAEKRCAGEEKTVLFYADRDKFFADENVSNDFSLEDEGMLTSWVNSGYTRKVSDMLDEQYYLMGNMPFCMFRERCDYFMKLLFLTVSSMNLDSSYAEKLEKEYYSSAYKSYSAKMLWEYIRDAFVSTAEVAVFATKKDTKSRILSCINDNIHSSLTLQSVAEECGISAQYLSTYFKKEMGINFKTYVDTLKISIAKKQLEQTDMSIQEIALGLGFSESKNFIRVFKKYESMTPGEYRERFKNAN